MTHAIAILSYLILLFIDMRLPPSSAESKRSRKAAEAAPEVQLEKVELEKVEHEESEYEKERHERIMRNKQIMVIDLCWLQTNVNTRKDYVSTDA